MKGRFFAWALFLLLAVLAVGAAARRRPTKMSTNPVSTQYPPEPHHSLHPPMDAAQSYFTFGGSTVATKKFMRLTPSTQDRRGFVWNEYPIESDDFEVEVKLEIFSNPHFGGDGMGIWFIHPEQDPSIASEPSALQGNIFGMREDFRGLGIMIDVYDNDGRRNNPAIFVIKNDQGKFHYSHDLDFEHEMIRTVPVGHDGSTADSYRCVADIRNLQRPIKLLLKYLNQVMHVYLDTEDGQGYRFCLAVKVDGKHHSDPAKAYLRDHHLVFTAATGQVADNMDLVEVTTRYLKSTDVTPDGTDIASFGTGEGQSLFAQIFWFIITVSGVGFLGLTIYEYQEYKAMLRDHVDSVAIAQRLNTYVQPHFLAHAAVTVALLVTLNFIPFLINLPLLVVRVVLNKYGALTVSSATIARFSTRGSGILGMSPDTRFLFALVTYALAGLVYCYQLFGN